MSKKLSRQHRERISHGLARYAARRRKLATVTPLDLQRLEADGVVPLAVKPLVPYVREEHAAWVDETADHSAKERTVLDSAARLLFVELALMLRFGQTLDPEVGTRIGTVASARRALLAAVGLERRSRAVPRLEEYLRTHDSNGAPVVDVGASAAKSGDPEVQLAPAADRPEGDSV